MRPSQQDKANTVLNENYGSEYRYMLGHRDSSNEGDWANAPDTYYEDIRDKYRQEIYTVGLGS